MSRSNAREGPTSLGNTQPMPYSAMRPLREKAVVNLAPAAAKRTSAMTAWTIPRPAQAPLTTAMTGLGSDSV